VFPPETGALLRDGYRRRIESDAVRRDVGEVLAHGEPQEGIGQGAATEAAAQSGERAQPGGAEPAERSVAAAEGPAKPNGGEVVVDFPTAGQAPAA
jgi:hypothetical protein